MPVNVTVVNLPVPGTLAPIFILLILPVVAGLTIMLPVPVGLMVTDALFGLRLVAPVDVKVVNVAALGVVAPITMLSKAPVVVGASVSVVLTDKFGIVVELAKFTVRVLVAGVVATVIPFEPVTFNVFVVAFNVNVS